MSREWEHEEQTEDTYRRMWEDIDDDWPLNDLLPSADWSGFDEPPDDGSHEPRSSSSTFDVNASARHLQPSAHNTSHSRSPHVSHGSPLVPPPMGNVASSTTQDTHPPSLPRERHRTRPLTYPTAEYSDDWLIPPAGARTSSFGYIPNSLWESLSDSREESEDIENWHPFGPAEDQYHYDMPPTTRGRGARTSIVDLTNEASSPPDSQPQQPQQQPQPRSLKRSAEESTAAASASRSHKRGKTSPVKVEEIDLSHEHGEAPSVEEELLQAQQQAAIAAQQSNHTSGPHRIGKRQCIICLDNYTNATTTPCGHMFCHECLTQALSAGERNSERGVGTCPVCRKTVSRKKVGTLIPIAFMKGSAFHRSKGLRDLLR